MYNKKLPGKIIGNVLGQQKIKRREMERNEMFFLLRNVLNKYPKYRIRDTSLRKYKNAIIVMLEGPSTFERSVSDNKELLKDLSELGEVQSRGGFRWSWEEIKIIFR